MQNFVGSDEVAQTHTNLAERRESDRETVPGSMRLVQREAAFGENERLLDARRQRCRHGPLPCR